MSMKLRIPALLLAMTMTAAVLAGCSKAPGSTTSTPIVTEAPVGTSGEPGEEETEATTPVDTSAPKDNTTLTEYDDGRDEHTNEEFWPGIGCPYFTGYPDMVDNSNVLSITVADPDPYPHGYQGTYTISFGAGIPGSYDFLYLNPQCNAGDQKLFPYFSYSDFGYIFECENYTDLLAAWHTSKENTELYLSIDDNYALGRTYEQRSPAEYHDYWNAGMIWCTYNMEPGESTWIDVRIIKLNDSTMIATLRLTVTRGEDGIFRLTDIRNKNLTENLEGNPEALLYGVTEEQVNAAIQNLVDEELSRSYYGTSQMTPDKFIVELRDSDTGMYYNRAYYAHPGAEKCLSSDDCPFYPLLAITYKESIVDTYYYTLLDTPTEEKPEGSFKLIAQDFYDPTSIYRLNDPDNELFLKDVLDSIDSTSGD